METNSPISVATIPIHAVCDEAVTVVLLARNHVAKVHARRPHGRRAQRLAETDKEKS